MAETNMTADLCSALEYIIQHSKDNNSELAQNCEFVGDNAKTVFQQVDLSHEPSVKKTIDFFTKRQGKWDLVMADKTQTFLLGENTLALLDFFFNNANAKHARA